MLVEGNRKGEGDKELVQGNSKGEGDREQREHLIIDPFQRHTVTQVRGSLVKLIIYK